MKEQGIKARWTPEQAMRRLGLPRTSFWRVIHDRQVPYVRYSAKLIRFDPAVIEQLEQQLTVSCAADLKQLVDGRRSIQWTA